MIKNLLIDPDCLGKTMYLASVAPYYKYDAQKQKTNEIEGYRYEVALAEKEYEKLAVKIPGTQQIDAKVGEMTAVAIEGLEVKVYVIGGDLKLSATAKKITKVKS